MGREVSGWHASDVGPDRLQFKDNGADDPVTADDPPESSPPPASAVRPTHRLLALDPLLPLAAVAGIVAIAAFAVGARLWISGLLVLAFVAATAGLAVRVTRARGELLQRSADVVRLTELRMQHGMAEQMAGLGIWVHDLVNRRLQWSEGAFKLFGIDQANGEPSPRGFLICVHPDDQSRWQDSHRRGIRSGREVRIEYRYVRQGRETIWIRSIARPERDQPNGPVVRMTGIAQDITGIRAMQQQLAASEAKYRDLTSMSSDWIWESDAQHRVSYLSDSVDAVLGTWARSTIGQRRWDIAAEEYHRVDWEGHRKAVESHLPFENFEYSQQDTAGNLFHFAISGRPVFTTDGKFAGYRGTGRNITREKQQRMLLEIEGEMASIMREQNEPQRVITAIIITLCGHLGWSGGAHLVRAAHSTGSAAIVFSVRERWGYPSFTRMASDLPDEMTVLADSAEAVAWEGGKSVWLPDVTTQPGFTQRYQTERLGVRAAFMAPILDEQEHVLSVLMFLSPVGYKGDEFLSQVAAILSRTLSLYLQRKAAERRLMHASLHDALTGLPNRVNLTHQLETKLRAGEPAAVLYVDLDRYKIINDTLGHSVGDQVLIEVGRRFRDAIRSNDVAGRIGGDEFILLLSNLSDRAEIEGIARRVLAAIEKPFILNNRAYFLSASIGVALAPADGNDAALLVKCADAAMYQVKSEGRNDVRFFAGGMSDERTAQLQLAAELPLAIQRGEVDLYYQPILDVGSRSVVGFEALLRWRHPVRGMLLPDKFLPIAEQSNLIREIGLWAIRRALDDRVQLGLDAYGDVAVSVNVSARQLTEDGFLAMLNALLSERNFPARLLRLELTESAFIENPDRTVALISELRRLGVRVIIDNFGTGYASLSYLKNLPVDGLKIDQTFIRDLPADRGNAAIVQAITTLAAKLGLQAMAEGVETSAELKALRSYDCDQLQGTLISEPLPFAQLQDFMESLPALRQMHLVKDATSG